MKKRLFTRSRTIGLGALGALLGLTGALAGAVYLGGEAAYSVTVRADGEVVSRTNLADALEEASAKAGFDVVAPANGPARLRVKDILVHPDVEAPPGVPKSDFRLVTLQLEAGGSQFLLDELRGSFNPSFSGESLPSAVDEADIYFDKTDTAIIYSMLVKERGFILSFPLDDALSQEESIAILAAFASQLE